MKLDDLPSELVKNPYKEIREWADKRFKVIGKSIFSYLALVPHSIFCPKIKYEDQLIPSNISFLLVSPPASAKTMIVNTLSEICYNPININKITPSEMVMELKEKDYVTLCAGDSARIFKDYQFNKLTEEVIYDGRLVWKTRRTFVDEPINANGVFATTPQDLSGILTSGLLSRLTLMIIMLSEEEQIKIGEEIVSSIGRTTINGLEIGDIKKYYNFIYQTQLGENEKQPRVEEVYIDNNTQRTILKIWEKVKSTTKTNFLESHSRELFSGFRYLTASAMLNIPNRDIEKGIIYPKAQDLNIAKILMANELRTKINLMKSEKFEYSNKVLNTFFRLSRDTKYVENYLNAKI